jgi:hypothetical protein
MATQKPTKQSIEAQISALSTQLAGVKNIRNVLVNPTADTYFTQTQDKKLDDVNVSGYTDTYNSEYEKVKNISLTFGADAKTANENDQAFFIFNAAQDAKQTTENKIAEEQTKKDAYTAQQEKIKGWIKEKQSSQDMSIFNMYLNDQIARNYEGLSEGYITSDSPLFNENKFRSLGFKDKHVKLIPVRDSSGKTIMKTVRMYKDPAAAQVMRQSLQDMYIKTFNDNESLRQTWTNKYTASLLQKQTALQKQLSQLNKKK